MRAALVLFVRGVDRLNTAIAAVFRWLILVSVLVCAATACLRYAFSLGYVWLQQLYVFCFGVTFLMLAAFAYRKNRHVRVDIFFARMTPRRRAVVEILGIAVFLLPWLAVLAWSATPFILSAWRILEGSMEPGGLPGLYIYKTTLWAFCLTLGLQAVAELVRNALLLTGEDGPEPEAPAPPVPGAL